MSRKIAIITLLAIALVLVAGASVYFGQQRQEGVEKVRREKEQVATLPEPTPSEIDTSDWKVYRNEKYGFEVEYPPTWVGPVMGDSRGVHIAKDFPPRSVAISIISTTADLWEFAHGRLGEYETINKCKWIKTNSGVSGVECTYKFHRIGLPPLIINTPCVFFQDLSRKNVIEICLPTYAELHPEEVASDFNLEIFDAIVKSFKYVVK